ncbi:MAG: molecular chaperone TorD family protein, partial [Raoultibacter sp.]
YEGSWHAAKKGERPLLFVNAEALAVGEACRLLGLERGGDANDSLDSIVIELEVLWCIALMAAGILECPKDVVAEEAWESFLGQHVTSWMGGFAEDTLNETREPFYKATACLLQAFVKSMG